MTASGLGYAAAVALAALFAVAALVKLRDPGGTTTGFEDLGVPSAALFARLVPFAELAVVALLLIVPPVGGIAALVTLAFFTTFLLGRIRAGVTAPCACFGAVVQAPLSGAEIVRNVGMMVLAAASLLADRPTPPNLAEAAVAVAYLAAGAATLSLLRRRRTGAASQ